MQIKMSQSQPLEVGGGTIDGLRLFAYLYGATADQTLVTADFKPQLITVQVELFRKGQVYSIYNSNLLLLGTYWSRKSNYEWFLNGHILVPDSAGVKAQVLRGCNLKFGSPIRVGANEKLVATVTANDGCFTANVDPALSFIDYEFTRTMGYERGVPRTKVEVVTTNAENGEYISSDNVVKAEFLNFDKTDNQNPVLSSVNFTSDKLNYSATWYQMLIDNDRKWPNNIGYRFGTSLPINPASPTVFRAQDWLPQSQTLFESMGSNAMLNKCSTTINFNSAQVAASQNWVISTSLYIDPASAQETVQRVAKHAQENIQRLVS